MPRSVYFKVDKDINPLADHILVHNMEQGDKLTKGGILIPDDNGKDRGIRPRWAQVYKVGSNVDYVEPGQWVLMEHGRWTFGIKMELQQEGGEVEEHYVQRIDTDAILLVTDENPLV